MSWSPDLFIGEFRPWPDTVHVVRGKTDETRRYVPHRTTTRHGKWRTKYGRSVPCCECCGYGIGDERWNYCPSCGAEVVE